MQHKDNSKLSTIARLLFVFMTYLATADVHAAQFQFTTPANSTGNNFTMLASDNTSIGGTNDVLFTWDGTLNDAVAGAVSNATLASDEAFFGSLWEAHDLSLIHI